MKRYSIALLVLLLSGCGPAGPAKKLAADKLRDPGSAEFRNIQVFGKAVCGEVSGKNAFGAYTGFRRFISLPDYADVVISPEPTEVGGDYVGFSERWDAECRLDNGAAVNPDAIQKRRSEELRHLLQETQQYGGSAPK